MVETCWWRMAQQATSAVEALRNVTCMAAWLFGELHMMVLCLVQVCCMGQSLGVVILMPLCFTEVKRLARQRPDRWLGSMPSVFHVAHLQVQC